MVLLRYGPSLVEVVKSLAVEWMLLDVIPAAHPAAVSGHLSQQSMQYWLHLLLMCGMSLVISHDIPLELDNISS